MVDSAIIIGIAGGALITMIFVLTVFFVIELHDMLTETCTWRRRQYESLTPSPPLSASGSDNDVVARTQRQYQGDARSARRYSPDEQLMLLEPERDQRRGRGWKRGRQWARTPIPGMPAGFDGMERGEAEDAERVEGGEMGRGESSTQKANSI